MSSLLLILLSAVFATLVAIVRIAPLRPFLNTPDVYSNALGLAQAHALAVPAVCALAWLMSVYVLQPLQLQYLGTPVLVALTLAAAAILEVLFRRRGRWLPARPAFALLLSANGLVLGVALTSIARARDFLDALLLAGGAAALFALLLLAAATLYERMRYADVPAPFRDAPLAMITAAIMALGFMGFTGLIQE